MKWIGKWTTKSKPLIAYATDNGLPAILAFMFWAIIALLVVFATAEGKDSPFTAFFTAFGAVGQTFFAWMVWRLSMQQFDFSRRVAKRQAQIDTYAHRVKLFEDYINVRKTLSVHSINEEAVFKLWGLSSTIERLFSKAVVKTFEDLGTRAMDLVEAIELQAEAERKADPTDTRDYRAERVAINKDVRSLQQQAFRGMRDELRIDIDDS